MLEADAQRCTEQGLRSQLGDGLMMAVGMDYTIEM